MGWESEPGLTGRRKAVTVPEELVLHLREAGAKRVYLSWTDAFRDGAIPITATFELNPEEAVCRTGSETAREMLKSVFEAIGDQLWFHAREWSLDWQIGPAFTEPQTDLIPLYDRGVEQKHGDGFNLRNLHFAYEAY